MIGQARRMRGFWLVAALLPALSLLGCGGGGTEASGGGGATESPAGPAISASPVVTATSPVAPPPSTVSASDLAAAERVAERLVVAVNDDRFALARSLMVDPDGWWGLDDMRAIRSIRLERVTVTRVEGPDAVLLQTELTRDPPPPAGGPDWPNFMLLTRDPSGSWRVAETATGP
jgi:hypothetical protein